LTDGGREGADEGEGRGWRGLLVWVWVWEKYIATKCEFVSLDARKKKDEFKLNLDLKTLMRRSK